MTLSVLNTTTEGMARARLTSEVTLKAREALSRAPGRKGCWVTR